MLDFLCTLCYNLTEVSIVDLPYKKMKMPYYLGYGIFISQRADAEKIKNGSKAFLALREQACDDIIIEVLKSASDERKKIPEIIKIMNEHEAEKKILYIPSIETLGDDIETIRDAYSEIINNMHIVVMHVPELSTCTLNGRELIPMNDYRRNELINELDYYNLNAYRGRKAKSPDARFRRVFWEWQNFNIDTNDIQRLLGYAKTTIYALSKEFMTNPDYADEYYREFKENMVDYEIKPVRGITLDKDTRNIVLACIKQLEDNWTEEEVWKTAHDLMGDNARLFSPMDYIRFRNNVTRGRSAMYDLANKYDKGTEYVNQLEEELRNM